uniref:C2H2-type domain-containing protein n=1 Tax=Moniliophthora roreri TaxID=221103 RepID=A0A0W0FSE2_MONRR
MVHPRSDDSSLFHFLDLSGCPSPPDPSRAGISTTIAHSQYGSLSSFSTCCKDNSQRQTILEHSSAQPDASIMLAPYPSAYNPLATISNCREEYQNSMTSTSHDYHDNDCTRSPDSGDPAKANSKTLLLSATASSPLPPLTADLGYSHPESDFVSGNLNSFPQCWNMGVPMSPSASSLSNFAAGYWQTSPPEGHGVQKWKVATETVLQASSKRRKKKARFRCNIVGCGQTFTSKHNLTHHANSHRGVKPYRCEECGKRFTTSSDCKRHDLVVFKGINSKCVYM